jgi:hypothetical protein
MERRSPVSDLPAHLPECLLIVTAEVDEAVEAE